MMNSDRDAERVRQHAHKVLAKIRALKSQERRDTSSPTSDHGVETDREHDGARLINGYKGPA
jgi:hypothetical protein